MTSHPPKRWKSDGNPENIGAGKISCTFMYSMLEPQLPRREPPAAPVVVSCELDPCNALLARHSGNGTLMKKI